jgi:hypothetical protein
MYLHEACVYRVLCLLLHNVRKFVHRLTILGRGIGDGEEGVQTMCVF